MMLVPPTKKLRTFSHNLEEYKKTTSFSGVRGLD